MRASTRASTPGSPQDTCGRREAGRGEALRGHGCTGVRAPWVRVDGGGANCVDMGVNTVGDAKGGAAGLYAVGWRVAEVGEQCTWWVLLWKGRRGVSYTMEEHSTGPLNALCDPCNVHVTRRLPMCIPLIAAYARYTAFRAPAEALGSEDSRR